MRRSEVASGADLSATSGGNVEVSASTLKASGDLTLTAEGSIGLSAQADSFYEEIHKTKSGFQKGKMDSTENVVTHQVTELSAGGDLVVTAKTGDVALEATRVASMGATAISAEDGLIGMLSVTDSDFKSVQQSGSNLFWQSMAGKGHDDTTVKMVTIDAGGGLTVTAGDGLVVEYKGGQANLADTLDRLSAEPGLAWLKDMQSRDDVAWNAVAEAHKSWDYKSQGLTGPAAAMISIALAVATYGVGASVGAAAGLTTTTAVAGGGTALTTAGVMANAAFTSLVTQASLSLINNQGNLGAVLKDLGSSSALQSLATAVVTAGVLKGISSTETFGSLLTQDTDLLGKIQNATVNNLAKSVVNTAAGVVISGEPIGTTLRTQLLAAAAGVIGEVGAKEIGNAYADAIKDGVDPIEYAVHKIAHAVLGCAAGAIGGGGCGAGAIGGTSAEIVSGIYTSSDAVHTIEADLNEKVQAGTISQEDALALVTKWRDQGIDIARLSAALSAFVAGQNVTTAANVGGTAAENNGLAIAMPAHGVSAEAVAAAAAAAGTTALAGTGMVIVIGGIVMVIAANPTTLDDTLSSSDNDIGYDPDHGSNVANSNAATTPATPPTDPDDDNNPRSISETEREKISTAKPNQSASPRNLQEQLTWDEIRANPMQGRNIKLGDDPRFPISDGFQKMSYTKYLGDGQRIEIHYQYNLSTGKIYDMKLVSPPPSP